MTRRERLEAKREKREEWAAKRSAKAEQRFAAADRAVDGIPFGQPILVGHHSERRHRAAIDRMARNMDAGVESQKMAAHHSQKADGLARQLEQSIFSDDPDAIEAIEARVADLRAERDRMKASNAAFKKGDATWAAHLGITPGQAAKRRANIDAGYSWMRKPHPAYEITNLGANIRRLEKRIETIRCQQSRSEKAEQAGGVVIEGDEWVRITFAEKPSREILSDLRAAGFRWGQGSWTGPRAKLPAGCAWAGERK